MATVIFIFIVLTFFHLFFQTIIVNLFLLRQRYRLLNLELALNEYILRNAISPSHYRRFKVLFSYSHDLLLSAVEIKIFIATHRYTHPEGGDNHLQTLFSKKGSIEAADLYEQWEKIMNDAFCINYYAWYIYLFPFIAGNQIKKMPAHKHHRDFQHWLSLIEIPSHPNTNHEK